MEKHRLQFDFDEITFQEINMLREATALPNRAQLVRHALRFLQWALDETKKGGTLLIEKDGNLRQVIFPFWHNASETTNNKKNT